MIKKDFKQKYFLYCIDCIFSIEKVKENNTPREKIINIKEL